MIYTRICAFCSMPVLRVSSGSQRLWCVALCKSVTPLESCDQFKVLCGLTYGGSNGNVR